MKTREFYNAIAMNETLDAEIREFAVKELGLLDAANARRRENASARKAERAEADAPVREMLINALRENKEAMTTTMLLEVTGLEITPQKVSTLMKAAVDSGVVVKTDVHIEGGKKRVGYMIAE